MSKWWLVLALISASAWAAPATQESVKKEHNFEDLLVQGKFHFSDETVVTVEGDKVLDALIGVRKDFKDRLEDSEKGY